jgi:hypothetical protein
MRLSRRPLFFAAIAVAALLLYEPTPPELRWLNLAMAGLAVFWFALLALEESARQRRRPETGKDRR